MVAVGSTCPNITTRRGTAVRNNDLGSPNRKAMGDVCGEFLVRFGGYKYIIHRFHWMCNGYNSCWLVVPMSFDLLVIASGSTHWTLVCWLHISIYTEGDPFLVRFLVYNYHLTYGTQWMVTLDNCAMRVKIGGQWAQELQLSLAIQVPAIRISKHAQVPGIR